MPDWAKLKPPVDLKDDALAGDLVSTLSMHPVQLVLREIATRIHHTPYDLIALMGDITSYGRLDEYELALKQLSPLFDVRRRNKNGARVVMVPGNHDVNRKTALQDGIEGKFSALNEIAQRYGWPVMPIRELSRIEVGGAQGCVAAFLINSCLGCGEKRFLPSTVRQAITDAIDTALLTAGTKDIALDEYYEQLDTPAIDEAAVRRMGSELEALPRGKLPVFIAHHNILPQREPRLAPYAELINGGQIRRKLISADRAVLYLHGHIHEDPIEIVSDPLRPLAKLISVSAPALEQGFNEITIFQAMDGQPCGIRVTPYRLRKSTGMVTEAPIDISVTTTVGRVKSRLAYDILHKVTEGGSVFWNELEQSFTKKKVAAGELEATTMELYFANYIRIDQIDRPANEWRISLG